MKRWRIMLAGEEFEFFGDHVPREVTSPRAKRAIGSNPGCFLRVHELDSVDHAEGVARYVATVPTREKIYIPIGGLEPQGG